MSAYFSMASPAFSIPEVLAIFFHFLLLGGSLGLSHRCVLLEIPESVQVSSSSSIVALELTFERISKGKAYRQSRDTSSNWESTCEFGLGSL